MGIGHLQLNKITAHHLNLFYSKLRADGVNIKNGQKLSPKTILHHHRLISVILQAATREGIIAVNPAGRDSIKPPKNVNSEVQPYQIDELRKLIASLDDLNIQWKTMIIILITTGIRRGELLALTWDDIDFNHYTITISKNVIYTSESGIIIKEPKTKNSKRIIAYCDSLLHETLLDYKEWYKTNRAFLCNGYLFTNNNNQIIHPDTVTKKLSRHCETHNLKHCTPHKLRHTYVSMMIAMNVPIKEISSTVGHAQLTTTCNVYAHQIALHNIKPLAPIEKLIYST